jgi:hypothetical protein
MVRVASQPDSPSHIKLQKMETYYEMRPRDESIDRTPPTQTDERGERMKVLSSEYARYRQSLVKLDEGEGWRSELRRYLGDRPLNVSKDTDIIKWWQASRLCTFY